jgi:hypothetical protein
MHTLRRWAFGYGEYAHPALRWAAWPVFRVAMLVFLVVVLAGGGGDAWTPWKIAVLALLGISLVADLANAVVLRSRRQG